MKQKIVSGLMWKMFEKFGVQTINLGIQIVLARLLLPSDYGALIILAVFLNVADILIQSSFGIAIVQKTKVTDKDCSTIFYFQIFMALFLYLVLWILAPYLGIFYKMPILSGALRFESLVLLIRPFGIVSQALLQREMKFRKLFWINLIAMFGQGIVGIVLAYLRCGLWSLIIAQLINSVITVVLLWRLVSWKPKCMFSVRSLKTLFAFSASLLAAKLIYVGSQNLFALVIGKYYSSVALGFYNRAQSMPNILAENIDGSVQGVIFPALSNYQKEPEKMKKIIRRSIRSSAFCVFPIMLGLAATARPVVILLLGERWTPCIPLLKLYCISLLFLPIHTANLQAITAMGRSKTFLLLEVIKFLLEGFILYYTLPRGIVAIMLGNVVNSLIHIYVNSYPNKKYLNYGFGKQVKDIMPPLCLAGGMYVLVSILPYIGLSMYVTFLLQILVGTIFYLGNAKLLGMESMEYMMKTGKEFLWKKISWSRGQRYPHYKNI